MPSYKLYSCYFYYFYHQMSSSKRSSVFVSPIAVEADQKEIIINHLKEEIYLLKRNEQQLYRLEDQYRTLEHRFKVLFDEKVKADSDFKERHDIALRTIGQLKNEIDALRTDLRQRNLELSDLQSDENTLNGQLDQRAIEINKLKNQLNSLLADSEELLNEKLKLEQTSTGVRKDNEQIGGNIRDLSSNNDSVRRKTEDMEKYLAKKKDEEALLKQRILAYENENNGLDSDINATGEDIAKLQNQISNAQNELSSIQSNIAQTSGQAERHKSQAIHYQKATQAEILRNNDLTKQLQQADNTLRLRNNQVAEGNKTIGSISGENGKLSELNTNLRNDIEYCRRHLENLSLLNSDLVINLEKYSEEDDIVRNLIDRKLRVVKARNRIEEASASVRTSTLQVSARKSRLGY